MNGKKTYEGMFLLDAGNPDFEAASEPVRNVLNRYEAEVLALKLWDERKLAYEIAGRKRGLYVLSYFKMDPAKVVELEHDCQLDERVLRTLILRRDRLGEQEINAETPAATGAGRRDETEPEDSDERPRRRRDDDEGGYRPRRSRDESFEKSPEAPEVEAAGLSEKEESAE